MKTTRENVEAELEELRKRIASLEQVLAEKERLEYEVKIKNAMLESSLFGIGLADLSGHVIYVNPACLRMWGYDSLEEVKGKPISHFWQSEEQSNESMAVVREVGTWTGEMTAKRKDGATFEALVCRSLIRDDSGQPLYLMASFLDLTEQKRMAALLAQSDKMAAVGQLAAGVAHEINNPASFVMTNLGQITNYLTKIMGMLDELQETMNHSSDQTLKEKYEALAKKFDIAYIRNDLEDVVNESLEGMVRIRNIVSDLRKFASWEEKEAEEIDLNQMVDSVLNLAMSEIKYRGQLEREYGEIPTFFGIQGRLSTAVMNLVLNAAQALDPENSQKNRITVTTGQDQDRIFIRVADTGHGIPPEILPRIFEPFFTTKVNGFNTGLGLAVAADIVFRSGGEITVQSKVGQGSVFTIWLPAPYVPEGPEKEAGAPPLTHRPKILIIDDEEMILKSMNRLLGETYDLALAESANTALALLNQDQDFDLILCDLLMPTHDGQFMYNEAIRRWPFLEPRFLFFTGGAYTSGLRGFAHLMKDRTLQKPLEAEKILATVEEKLRSLASQSTAMR